MTDNESRNDYCHHLLGSLSDYVDEALSEEFCAEIKHHLEGCENCRVMVDTLRKTVYLYHVSAAGPAEVPSEARERLYKRLQLDEFTGKESR
jgi:anti-sigma factor RsiW